MDLSLELRPRWGGSSLWQRKRLRSTATLEPSLGTRGQGGLLEGTAQLGLGGAPGGSLSPGGKCMDIV